MAFDAVLRGYLLEEALAWMLRNAGYRLLVHSDQDRDELTMRGSTLRVKGRGASHQVDVLGEFVFTPAFSLPIRLFLEAKFYATPCELPVVRNALGVIDDVNENYVHSRRSRPRRRHQYVYALFSASGFTRNSQDYALAQQISLVDISGASFNWLRDSIWSTAADLYQLLNRYTVQTFPVSWMRQVLRTSLGTDPLGVMVDEQVTNAPRFRGAAEPVIREFAAYLVARQDTELLLGFPAAPLILPLGTETPTRFITYAEHWPTHKIWLRRTGGGPTAEWIVSPRDHEDAYQLTFNLPERIEAWISDNEAWRVERTRAIKTDFLSEITVYRLLGDEVKVYQLRYEPGELRRPLP